MKAKKNYFVDKYQDDEEYADLRKGQKRRPIRNWTKTFIDHQDQVDEIDDFYSNKRSYR